MIGMSPTATAFMGGGVRTGIMSLWSGTMTFEPRYTQGKNLNHPTPPFQKPGISFATYSVLQAASQDDMIVSSVSLVCRALLLYY